MSLDSGFSSSLLAVATKEAHTQGTLNLIPKMSTTVISQALASGPRVWRVLLTLADF